LSSGQWVPGDGRKPPSVTPAFLGDGAGDIDLCALPSDPKTGRIGHLGLLPGGLAVSSGPHRRQGLAHHPVGCGGVVSAPLPVLSHPPWKGLQCLEEGGLSSAAVKGHRRSPTISRQGDARIICYLNVQTRHDLGQPSRTQYWVGPLQRCPSIEQEVVLLEQSLDIKVLLKVVDYPLQMLFFDASPYIYPDIVSEP